MSSSTPSLTKGAWYGAAALGALGLAAAPADAQIVFTDIDDVTLTDNDSLLVDFDADGDFELSLDTQAAATPGLATIGVDDDPDTKIGAVASTTAGYQYWLPLSAGTTVGVDNISTTGAFQFGPSFTFRSADPNGWIGAGDKFMGIQISLDDGTGQTTVHNGWINIEITAVNTMIVKGWAYETEPEASIITGDVGVVATEPGALEEGYLFSEVAPNPVVGRSSFDLAVGAPEAVTVDVFDTIGRRVSTIFSGDMTPGASQTIELDATALPAGVYVVRVSGESFVTTRNVTVVR